MFEYTEVQKRAPVLVRIIPHEEQRYPTVGDYWWDELAQVWQMRISQMPDQRWEWLIEIHERIELMLCIAHGISMEAIDAFDFAFEADVKAGRRSRSDEPGDDSASPYYWEHQLATTVERFLANALQVDWEEYGRHVGSL